MKFAKSNSAIKSLVEKEMRSQPASKPGTPRGTRKGSLKIDKALAAFKVHINCFNVGCDLIICSRIKTGPKYIFNGPWNYIFSTDAFAEIHDFLGPQRFNSKSLKPKFQAIDTNRSGILEREEFLNFTR